MKNQTPLTSYDFLFLGLTILIIVTLSFQLSILPSDYWWCLRVGHETLVNGAIPSTDTFSWTQTGKAIVYQPWLSCVGLWLTYDFGGASLTYLLRAILLGLTYGAIWYMARQESGPRLATIIVIIMALTTGGNWVMRTQLFAYPLFAVSLYSLFNWQKGNNRTLWILPAATLLWSNLHGSFILALILAGTAFVFGKGDRKPLFIAGLLMLAATLITPHGLDAWRQAVFMLGNPSDQLFSTEWFPPKNEGWQSNLFFGWLLIMPLLAALSSRKFSTMEWIIFLGFGWLALSGVRYIIWFLFFLAILTARLIDDITRQKLESTAPVSKPAINYVIAGMCLILPLLSLPGIRETWWSDAPAVYDTASTPIKATAWLAEHPELPGPLWNDDGFGSYLIFALPARQPWIDARYFVYPPEQMETHIKISGAHPEWETLLDDYKINLLMLSVKNQPRLIIAAEKSDQWCEQYRDKTAVIFSRCTPIQ